MLPEIKGKGGLDSLFRRGRGKALGGHVGQELPGGTHRCAGLLVHLFPVALQMWTPTCLSSCVSVFLKPDHREPWRWMSEPGLVNARTSRFIEPGAGEHGIGQAACPPDLILLCCLRSNPLIIAHENTRLT